MIAAAHTTWHRGRWRKILPYAALTLAEGVARLLSFGFYVVAARKVTVQSFGDVKLTIVVATLAASGSQVVGMVLTRDVGGVRGAAQRLRMAVGVGVTATLWSSLLGGLVAYAAIFTSGVDGVTLTGLVAVLAGTAAFQAYYAIGRGLGAVGRMAIVYCGGSLTQLVVVVALEVIHRASAVSLSVAFGLSSLLPIAICEATSPVVRGHVGSFTRNELRDFVRACRPVLLGHVMYLIWFSLDQIWLARDASRTSVGLYGAARTLTQVFLILPMGVYGVLLPRIAELRGRKVYAGARRLTYGAIATTALLSIGLLALVVVLGRELLRLIYGPLYASDASALVYASLGICIYAVLALITSSAIGWNRSRIFPATMAVAVAVEVLFYTFAPPASPTVAGQGLAISAAAALAFVLLLLRARPLHMQ